MADKCPHKQVEIYEQLYACATLYEPAEYIYKVQCVECGEWMDLEDIDGDETEIVEQHNHQYRRVMR